MELQKRSEMFFRHIIIYCLCFYLPILAQARLPEDMHELAVASINNVYDEKFKMAKSYAKRIIKNYTNHPAGYFFYAAILNSHMEYLQSEQYEAEFYRYCDNAISKGENLLEKEPGNVWVKFFVAGASGLKGTYESRYKRWLTAFKHGWRGVVIFREILETNPEMVDALYGIATYDYWRSAKTKMLWWLPGVEDKRGPAIQELNKLQVSGIYVKECSSLNLIDMLLNEERYNEALENADKILASYPSSLIAMWRKAEAHFGLEEYDKAEKVYNKILSRLEFEQFESNYNRALCHYYLSKVYFHLERYKSCMDECNLMESLKLTSVSQKRLEEKFRDAITLEKKAQRKFSPDK